MNAQEAIYARLPSINCKGLCVRSCGPVPCQRAERDAMRAAAGGKPHAIVKSTGMCAYLEAGRCSVYAQRPLICRLYGVVEKMRYPHGCEPSRWLSDGEAAELLRSTAKASGQTCFPEVIE